MQEQSRGEAEVREKEILCDRWDGEQEGGVKSLRRWAGCEE